MEWQKHRTLSRISERVEMNDEMTILINYESVRTVELWAPSSCLGSYRNSKVGWLEKEVVLGSPVMSRPGDVITKREIKVPH